MGSYSTSAQDGTAFEGAQAESWPRSEECVQELQGLLPAEPSRTEDSDLRSVLLAKAVEYEIIPRLMLAHRAAIDRGSAPAHDFQRVQPSDVHAFAQLILHEDDALVQQSVGALRDRGVPVETVFIELLAPVARYLGELWERDLCTFTEVTVGLGRLQQVLRDNSGGFGQTAAQEQAPEGRRVLLMPCPGEQHTFGLSLVAEFFHRAGWDVATNLLSADVAPAAIVKQDWYDVVGFSVGSETGFPRLHSCMEQIRKNSLNPHISIIAGGAVFALHPDYARQTLADAIITDGRLAPELAEKLVASRSFRTVTQ
jgi:methanogenic corrinoid protein MtbC1